MGHTHTLIMLKFQMEMGLSTGVIHFCDTKDFICEINKKCSFDRIGDFLIFDMSKKPDCNRIRVYKAVDDTYFTAGTIVWDRVDSKFGIHMPRPLKKVSCSIRVLPTTRGIRPVDPPGPITDDVPPPPINMTF